jgi:hypothetical protein
MAQQFAAHERIVAFKHFAPLPVAELNRLIAEHLTHEGNLARALLADLPAKSSPLSSSICPRPLSTSSLIRAQAARRA